jgi:DNA end-binding protein Ku
VPGIWKGSIAFGLVNIPVELRTAVRDHRLSFRMLHGKDHTPIKFKRVREDSGKEVPWDEIVKGYEVEKDEFIVLEKQDFKDAAVEQTHTIEILDFVDEHTIDPRFYDRAYIVVPSKGADKAYALLRDAMAKTKSVGIGKIIVHQRQHIAEVRADGDALVLMMLRFADELVPMADYSFPATPAGMTRELKMAEELVDSLRGEFDPSKYTDEYDENLRRIIKSKSKGKSLKLVGPAKGERAPKVLDLMERLQESLNETKGKGKGKEKTAPSTRTPTRAVRSRKKKTAAA